SMFTEQFIETLVEAIAKRVADKLSRDGGAKRLFDIRDAAVYVGRTPKAVEHLIARGVIPVCKIDGKRQVDRAALDKLIDDRTYYDKAA
ncbi:MAG TPA: helix-turn-helix domain-containing protein, partial [Bryobacteraceae bacterium]|nr:helix-turn-helix domain-containing protein [Bryobacteraceae bacterium]